MGNRVGRRRSLPRVLVSCWLVVGLGAVPLTGPEMAGVFMQWRIAWVRSWRVIQLR